MKRALITGSGGMLGVDLCEELRDYYEIFGIDIAGSRKPGAGNKFKKADITDKNSIEAAVKEVKPDIVIHTAAWTDVDGCELDSKKAYKINSAGTKNIALACKKIGAVLIYISTDFVFDGKKKQPYKESDRVKPLSVYGYSKLKGEEALRRELKKYFILRTSWLYGKHGKNFVDAILMKAGKEKSLGVVYDQVGSPTYTKDLAKAIRVLIHRRGNMSLTTSTPRRWYGVYHVSNSGAVSWYEYAKEIVKLARLSAKVIPITAKELGRPAKRPAMSVLDNSKFVKFTGYKLRAWQEALKEYVRKS